MKKDLLELSIRGVDGKTRSLIEKRPEYRRWVTFEGAKHKPVYNWFHYKEGFSPQLVWGLLDEMGLGEGARVIDPFCGTGTTLLACRERNVSSLGVDVLPLSVYVSNTKLQCDYDMELLAEQIRRLLSAKYDRKKRRWPEIRFFNVKKAMSRYAYSDILFYREKIMEVEEEDIRNFLFLGLLSIVIGCSNIKKDGGVLKIKKREHVPPVTVLLKNRLKKMYADLQKGGLECGAEAKAVLGDARDLPVDDELFDGCISSPPYLNWVDYTKVYALELSLLLSSGRELRRLRKQTLKSHVGSGGGGANKVDSPLLYGLMDALEIKGDTRKNPQVVLDYFTDLASCLSSLYNSLREGAKVAFVLSNTCLPSQTIDVDLITAEISENQGFNVKKILVSNTRWCDVHGIIKERPVRESIVLCEK